MLTPTQLRAYLVIVVGVFISATLIVSTLRRVRVQSEGYIQAPHLHRAEALGRLLLGVDLVLLALFVLAGRTLWVGLPLSTLPGWALPTGVASLVACVLGGLVAGGCALARWQAARR
jgi:uncharacterized integral membrane protein